MNKNTIVTKIEHMCVQLIWEAGITDISVWKALSWQVNLFYDIF